MAMFGPVSQTSSIKPLSFLQFSEQLLVPFIAVHAISQELGTNMEDTFDILQESTTTGMQLQPEPDDDDDDPDLEAIRQFNIARCRASQPGNGASASATSLHHSDDVRPPKFQKQSYASTTVLIAPPTVYPDARQPGPSKPLARQSTPVRSTSPLSPIPPSQVSKSDVPISSPKASENSTPRFVC